MKLFFGLNHCTSWGLCVFLISIFGLGLDIFKIFNLQEGIIQNIINL
ncbi:hypothetical protein [uncultured Gammaproteobacteria bacterium]|nr:hypothetical protein [uncultured Gammaproteobacteria bacterium]